MKPVADFFHPHYNGWQEYKGDPPEAIMAALPGLDFGDGLTIGKQTLSFYPDAEFLIFKHPGWAPANLFVYALNKGDELVLLNGTSPGIHQFNAAGNLDLSEDNALEYLHFFCFFVRGEEGPFYVANTPDALYLPSEVGVTAEGEKGELRPIFEQRFQSPRYFGKAPGGDYRFSVLVMYSNAMFAADFEVKSSGMIEMNNDTPVMADLPSKIDAPLVPPN